MKNENKKQTDSSSLSKKSKLENMIIYIHVNNKSNLILKVDI